MPFSDWHTHFPGGALWNVTPAGVGINGATPVGTAGPPDTVRRVLGWFSEEIAAAAHAYQMPAALLVAIICTESAGGEHDISRVLTARREEPGFVSDDATPSRVSVGCCQTLLSTARMALGKPGLTSQDLAHPATSISAAAAYVASQAVFTRFDPPLVAAAYNAGSLHEDKAPANRWRMRCYPLGTGEYIGRFVKWFNDAVAALGAEKV